MSYVPIVPVVPHTPSHQTRELADQLARVIVDFEQKHPTMNSAEIREAAQLALQASRRGGGAPMAAISVAIGVVMLLVGVLFYLGSSGALGDLQVPWVSVSTVILMIVLGAVAFVARRNSL